MPSHELHLNACAYCGSELAPGATQCGTCGKTVSRAAAVAVSVSSTWPVMGVLLGKWQLDRKLGQGGMGAVYLAHELELERPVAVKLLSDSLCDDA